MKKILSILRTGVCILIGILIFLIMCIGYLLFVPFDIIRYHRMPYYKDCKVKYQFFITSMDIVKIYNRIVREQLPIEYFRNNDFEYLVKDNQVLLCGWSYEGFEQADGEWFFVLDDEYNPDSKMTMKETLEIEIELLRPEHKSLPAKFLIFYNDITDADKFEKAKECPYFHCVFSVDEGFI